VATLGTSNDRGKKVGSSSRAPRDEEIDKEDFTKAVDACGTDSEVDDGPLNHHGKKGDKIGSSASQNESPVIDDLSPAAWSMPERRETFLLGIKNMLHWSSVYLKRRYVVLLYSG